MATERCRLGEAVAAASKTCSLHSKDYDPCFIHWYQGTFLSRDKWETYLLRGLDTSFESRDINELIGYTGDPDDKVKGK